MMSVGGNFADKVCIGKIWMIKSNYEKKVAFDCLKILIENEVVFFFFSFSFFEQKMPKFGTKKQTNKQKNTFLMIFQKYNF